MGSTSRDSPRTSFDSIHTLARSLKGRELLFSEALARHTSLPQLRSLEIM